MDPALEVDLAEALDPDPLRGVDEVPDLDRVAGEERDRLGLDADELAPIRR